MLLFVSCVWIGFLFCISVYIFLSSRRRHTRCALVTGVQTCALPILDLGGRWKGSRACPVDLARDRRPDAGAKLSQRTLSRQRNKQRSSLRSATTSD